MHIFQLRYIINLALNERSCSLFEKFKMHGSYISTCGVLAGLYHFRFPELDILKQCNAVTSWRNPFGYLSSEKNLNPMSDGG